MFPSNMSLFPSLHSSVHQHPEEESVEDDFFSPCIDFSVFYTTVDKSCVVLSCVFGSVKPEVCFFVKVEEVNKF